MAETYFYSWAIIWFPLVTFHVKDYSWKWWSVLWMSVETGKNFIQPPETPYEKKIVFFKVIEASLQAKGFWSGPPLGLQRWGRVGVCGSLILVCTHFFYVILKRVIYRGCAEITDLKPAWRWALLQPFVLAFRNF